MYHVRSETAGAWPAIRHVQESGPARHDERPTYRHDAAGSGCTAAPVDGKLKQACCQRIGGRLTAPVVAASKLLITSINQHTLYVLHVAAALVLHDRRPDRLTTYVLA